MTGEAFQRQAPAEPPAGALGAVAGGLAYLGETGVLLLGAVRAVLRRRASLRQAAEQVQVIGIASAPAVMVTCAFSGAVGALHTADQFVRFGMSSFVGGAVALAVAREVAPVLAAVIVLARAGSAMAAEIGSMNVTEQLDALRSLGVGPVEYLVSPRLLAGVVAMPMLYVLSVYAGCVGGFVVANLSGVSLGEFVESVGRFLEMRDVIGGALKSVAFAVVIVLVCCNAGLRVTGGAAGVGRQTTAAVVISLMAIYILNYFLATLIW
jgi:phospholipid/cholesterol/gamma-HCH transport system permease protein